MPKLKNKSAMIGRNFLLRPEEAEALRDAAYRERRTQASIVREAIRQRLKLK
jgi:predicted DNA-binding protein